VATRSYLGEFEQMVLLAILHLGTEAYGYRVGRLLEDRVGREVTRGALYACLDRLERKGFVRWEIEGTSSERPGSRRRRFEVTEEGLESVRRSVNAFKELWTGLEGLLARRSS